MIKISSILLVFACFVFSACEESRSEALEKVDVLEIKKVGQLSTSEYTIAKVLKLSDDTEWYKFGDRKLIIRCEAKVKAGVDLSKVEETDIMIDGTSIEITLPKVEIISFNINPYDITTEAEQAGGLRQKFTQAEKQKVMQLGEQAIKEKLGETKILEDAQSNAEKFVENFYKSAGFEKVIVNFKKIQL